jgi:hypothetical protein
MAKAARLVAIGVAVMAAVSAPVRAAWAQDVALTLNLQDRSGIPADVLDEARVHVADIFEHAGIAVRWQASAPFTIVILTTEMAAPMHQDAGRIGFAPATNGVAGRLAYVLNARVDAVAGTYKADKAIVLGAAVAHELGHLLLPVHAHSSTGIMRADWNETDLGRAKQGNLLFVAREARLIRARLAH